MIDYLVQSQQNRHLDQQLHTASGRGYAVFLVNSTDLLILLHHRILVFFTIVFLLDFLNLRLHHSVQFGEFLLFDLQWSHQKIYDQCK